MKRKQSRLGGFLYCLLALLPLTQGLWALGQKTAYPALNRALAVLALGLATACVLLLSRWIVGGDLAERLAEHPKAALALEWGLGAALLALSGVFQAVCAGKLGALPDEASQTLYPIAQQMAQGTLLENQSSRLLLAAFPKAYGYCRALGRWMKLFGQSYHAAVAYNIVCALLGIFFAWRSAVCLAGRGTGLLALALLALWPGQLFGSGFLTPEHRFFALYYGSLWLFLRLAQVDLDDGRGRGGLFLGQLLLGILLGLTTASGTGGIPLLLGMLAALLPVRAQLPVRPENDLPVTARAMAKGWLRAALILVCFLCTAALSNKVVSYAVDSQIASGIDGVGYDAMAGLDSGSEEENRLAAQALWEQGRQGAAFQRSCRENAAQVLQGPWQKTANLFFKKHGTLWAGNTSDTARFADILERQGTLTDRQRNWLEAASTAQNGIYLLIFAFSLLGVLLPDRQNGWETALVWTLLGSWLVGMLLSGDAHAVLDPLLILLAAAGLHRLHLRQAAQVRYGNRDGARQWLQQQDAAKALQRIEEAQSYAQKLQQQKMEGQFDMAAALREGHVRVSVSEAVAKEALEKQEEQV